MEKKQPPPPGDASSPPRAEGESPGGSGEDSSDSESVALGMQEVQMMRQHLFPPVPSIVTPIPEVRPTVPAIVTPAEEPPAPMDLSRRARPALPPLLPTVSSRRSPILAAMLETASPTHFDLDILLGARYIEATSASPGRGSSGTASSSQSPSGGSVYVPGTSSSPSSGRGFSRTASSSQFRTRGSSSQSPSRGSYVPGTSSSPSPGRGSSGTASSLQFQLPRGSSSQPPSRGSYVPGTSISPSSATGSSSTVSSSRLPTRGSRSPLASSGKRPSSQSLAPGSTYAAHGLSPTKRFISQPPSENPTSVAPGPSPRSSSQPPASRSSLPTSKRSSSQSPGRGSGMSASGCPSRAKQPKLHLWASGKDATMGLLMLTQELLKCMERIHFHPIHEYCTCQDIIEGDPFHIPDSTKVVETISEEAIEIRVDVRVYEINDIFVRIEGDKITVEATKKAKAACYEYHHLYLVFSIPGTLQNKRLRATIKNGELMIKSISDPEDSSKRTKDATGGAKRERAPKRPASENVTHVASVRQDDGNFHQPRPVEFTTFASPNQLKLKLNVGLFRLKDITVNLIEDKILIEAAREAHDVYEFHYLHRAVKIPRGLQEPSLSAKIRDGVLTIEGIIKPITAEPRKIPWLTYRARPVFLDENPVRVPVVGPVVPYSPEPSRFTASICDGKFTVKLYVSMFGNNKIHVRAKGKLISVEAERCDSSPFEYHSMFHCFELPTKMENFDIKSRIKNKFLIIEGTVKSEQDS